MSRELLLEIGCEELPAPWLPPLIQELGVLLGSLLTTGRLNQHAPIETFGTPRRLVGRAPKLDERQEDTDELIMGPAVSVAFDAQGQPTGAALGFARKNQVDAAALERVETPKGTYVACRVHHRGKPAVDVLPTVVEGVLRGLTFPKQMRWDARLEDGRGELLFGRPIRWLMVLYGGRVVPFTILRSEVARAATVEPIRSAAITYGHRFLASSGRAGRAITVRSFDEYRARLTENFVILERQERREKIQRGLESHARRLGGRLTPIESENAGLIEEVTDLVEYPGVVAGSFPPEFLQLPREVLATTMVHHQHFFPVVGEGGRLLPAFLAVTNTAGDDSRAIAHGAERVLMARLRDATFFWESDRGIPLEQRVEQLGHVLFHEKLGTYRAKADRIERLARWIALEEFHAPEAAAHAGLAGRLAKADLTTSMVREFTELQGVMGGIYAAAEGRPPEVSQAIYYHYLPTSVDPMAPPTRDALGKAAVTWAAVALADKVDSLVGLHAAGERATGSRDPYGLRRQSHGIMKILVDLPELTGLTVETTLHRLVDASLDEWRASSPSSVNGRTSKSSPELSFDQFDVDSLTAFLVDRLRYLLSQRSFAHDEILAVTRPMERGLGMLSPLGARRRLEALRAIRGSADFEALAVLFKRVKNIARELPENGYRPGAWDAQRTLLTEPAERALVAELDQRAEQVTSSLAKADYRQAFQDASTLRPAVDRYFTDVFVMVDDEQLRTARLSLMVRLRNLILDLADISEIAPHAHA